MRGPYAYERYLNHESYKYAYESDVPEWLQHESDAYFKIFDFIRNKCFTFYHGGGNITRDIPSTMSKIRTDKINGYTDLYDPLRQTVVLFTDTFGSLYDRMMTDDAVWRNRPVLFTKQFMRTFKDAAGTVWEQFYSLKPDPEWREATERARCAPLLTPDQAETLALSAFAERFSGTLSKEEIESVPGKFGHRMLRKDRMALDLSVRRQAEKIPVWAIVDLKTSEVVFREEKPEI